ncbi:MAG TPA: PDZ domain-containing protein, partial [Xanthobacteraceae bacterium]|nr:PDZ domain-containing protein [Xanthobacteraceae bacterium]
MLRISTHLLCAVAGAALALMAGDPRLLDIGAQARSAKNATYQALNLFGDVFERIRADYVEKPSDEKLIAAAIEGMLAELDPRSTYLDAAKYRDMQTQTAGTFGGVGLEVKMDGGLVKVVWPIEGGPAGRAGVRTNDVIVALDDAPVQGLTLNQAVEKMRGPLNTPIRLRI